MKVVEEWKLKTCDKKIDPLREVMFEVTIADELMALGFKDSAEIHIRKAKDKWLPLAYSMGSAPRGELEAVKVSLDSLERATRKIEDWQFEIDPTMEKIIDTTFANFAKCICTL